MRPRSGGHTTKRDAGGKGFGPRTARYQGKGKFDMRIAFFDEKPYDHLWFDPLAEQNGLEIRYFEYKLGMDTASLAQGFDAVCVFVNDDVSAGVLDILCACGVRLLVLRCAGYNNVDVGHATGKIRLARVPNYSPCAVAEHAWALLLSINRRTYRAYARTRDNNFSIHGLMGVDLRGKTVGVIGTGRIGRVFIEIARGFGMRVAAFDAFPAPDIEAEYMSLSEVLACADVISLHCPLTAETHHLINRKNIARMKDGVLLINTSRGALVDTEALLEGLKSRKIGGAGLDVYEEEENYFFEDLSGEILDDDSLARLLSFPNVLVTSHQAFFTREAMRAIAETTVENVLAFKEGRPLPGEIITAAGAAALS